HRGAAGTANDVESVPGESRVVHDARAALLLEEGLGEQPHEVVALNEVARLIEEEAAVVVAVPGETHVRAHAPHRCGGGGTILLEHGIRDTVGEVAVGLVIDFYELERQIPLERIDDELRTAVAGVDDDPEWAQPRDIHVTEQVLEVLTPDIKWALAARPCHLRGQTPTLDECTHLLETCVGADRARPLTHEL